MLGILVQLSLSWAILWFFEKKNLTALGLLPNSKRVSNFFIFLMITMACCASGYLLRIYFFDEHWFLNPQLSSSLIFSGIWWNLKSVLFEELIFRGAILYILIKRIGHVKAIIISAVAFGIYHWFSFGILGNIPSMAYVLLITGAMGLLLAYAFYKTITLLVPVAIHLGWNVTQQVVFSESPIGQQLLIKESPQTELVVSWLMYITILAFPMIITLVLNYLLLKKQTVVQS